MPILLKHFQTLRDPRKAARIDRELIGVIAIAVLAVICGAEGWDDMDETSGSPRRAGWAPSSS